MTDKEQRYFEALLEQQFKNVHSKLNEVINLQTIANGRTTKNENEIQNLKEWRASSQGSWKSITAIGSIIGAIIGGLAAIIFG